MVQFKLCLLAYKAVHGLAPHYLADMSSVDARRRLRSATCEDLVIPRTATKFRARSFAVAAPSEWNRLLLHIRSKPRSSAIALMGALVMTLLCCGALEIVCVLLLLLKWSVRIQFDRQLELLFKANEYKYCHTLKWVWFSSAVVSPQHKCQSRCLTLDSSDVNTLHCVDIHLPDEQRPRHCCVHIDHNVETLHLRSSTTRHLQRSYISIM